MGTVGGVWLEGVTYDRGKGQFLAVVLIDEIVYALFELRGHLLLSILLVLLYVF